MVISFSDVDLEGISLPHEDALVVQVRIANRAAHRMLVDTGASVDVISLEAYRQFGFSDDKLKPEATYLHGFLGASSSIRATIELPVTFGDHPRQATIMVTFMIKFPTENGVSEIKGDQKKARECYALFIKKNNGNTQGMALCVENLISDQRDELTERRGKSVEDLNPFPLSEDEPTKTIQVGLHVDPARKLVQQKWRNFILDRQATIKEEVEKLNLSGFIREEKFPTWLVNVVMVLKSNGKWRMCVDYNNLNKACPKDEYSLPRIDC
ncbi:uncharacterized protein LOC122659191 [Telopea speciosissima]|uniref:uncharacterized protein LOC122659191 n=1 Tax=Telopea speciosissima TaxID=54955 RepID=UPI001CC390AD|nr:uncharacterized protein LOC122659191 [Telopea speciosissima]